MENMLRYGVFRLGLSNLSWIVWFVLSMLELEEVFTHALPLFDESYYALHSQVNTSAFLPGEPH